MRLFVSHKTEGGQRSEARRGDPPKRGPVVPAAKLEATATAPAAAAKVPELGGPSGPEPTRYGDWERKGICSDF